MLLPVGNIYSDVDDLKKNLIHTHSTPAVIHVQESSTTIISQQLWVWNCQLANSWLLDSSGRQLQRATIFKQHNCMHACKQAVHKSMCNRFFF